MKKYILLLTFFIFTGIVYAQENETTNEKSKVLILGKPSSGLDYKFIDFPRRNVINKRGAIANFNNLVGKKVIVENVVNEEKGAAKTFIRRKDGLKFFRFFPTITVNLQEAIASGELLEK